MTAAPQLSRILVAAALVVCLWLVAAMAQTATPTWTPTSTSTWTPTWTPTRTPTWSPTSSPTRTGTITQTPTVTITGTRTPTNTRTVIPTRTGTNTRTPTLTPTITATAYPTRRITPRALAELPEGQNQPTWRFIVEDIIAGCQHIDLRAYLPQSGFTPKEVWVNGTTTSAAGATPGPIAASVDISTMNAEGIDVCLGAVSGDVGPTLMLMIR